MTFKSNALSRFHDQISMNLLLLCAFWFLPVGFIEKF